MTIFFCKNLPNTNIPFTNAQSTFYFIKNTNQYNRAFQVFHCLTLNKQIINNFLGKRDVPQFFKYTSNDNCN